MRFSDRADMAIGFLRYYTGPHARSTSATVARRKRPQVAKAIRAIRNHREALLEAARADGWIL